MKEFRIIKLKNLTPFHIGTGKEHYDFSSAELQSDTISAALASIRAQQGKTSDIEDFLNSFSISSAFPYYKSDYFLPKIQGKLSVAVEGCEESEVRKQLKKIRYVVLPLWHDIIKGKKIIVNKEQLKSEYLIEHEQDFENPFKSDVMQRVSIPREDGIDADPFYFNWTYTNKDAGFYCIVDSDENTFEEIKQLFIKLGEAGIGTDRHVGGGTFKVDTDTINLDIPEDNDSVVLLSLYIPTKNEVDNINLTESKYELVLRGGYMAGSDNESLRHLRKKSVYMFATGSIFKTKSTLIGKIVNIMPEWNDVRIHPVYRSGKPLCINVKTTSYE